MRTIPVGCLLLASSLFPSPVGAGEAPRHVDLGQGLAGHWPLAGDARDRSAGGNHARAHGVTFKAGAAVFDGMRAYLEVPTSPSFRLGKGDFSVALWADAQRQPEGPGDLFSQYDPARRRGFHLTLKTSTGVTFSQPNARHLQFGIDDNRTSRWIDCGRPGKAVLAFALAAYEGQLYAGTCEPGKEESGRVYRYAGGQKWLDCGAPTKCNAVTALAVQGGKLYAGVGKYRLAGSALPESANPNQGGRVYRFEGGTKWADCGELPGSEAVAGLVVFRGRLCASSLYRPAGFFRYEGGTKWSDAGTPNGKRVAALGIYQGQLYATGYDEGHVYRYDGKAWADLGRLGKNTQTYALAVHEGRLMVGTWPGGQVYRLGEKDSWEDVGRLGEELEVMGMLVHNGRLLAGTLPRAEVYSWEGGATWRRLAQLDATPGVKYRRAWTMAEHQGQLFCSTLPSGRIYAFAAGTSVSWDHELPAGWRHLAAVKKGDRCALYIDGKLVAQSVPLPADGYDLDSDRPLRIGLGANGHFRGRLRDVRLYQRALTPAELRQLARRGDSE